MMSNKIYIIVLISFIFVQCQLKESKIISKNTIPIESISPDNEDFKDLDFLKEKLENKKIIFLGESSHGDGTTFQAKTRLIKYLYKELGFKIVAFEGATISDLYFTNLKIQKTGNFSITQNQLKKSIASIWSASNEFREFSKFVSQNCDSIDLIGIDSNFSITHRSSSFLKFLKENYNIDTYPKLNYEKFENRFKTLIIESYNLNDTIFNFEQFANDVKSIKTAIDESPIRNIKEKDFLFKELENLKSFSEAIKAGLDKGNLKRDNQMAKNLIWTIKNHYPKEKVIVWTANFHAAKNIKEAIYRVGDDRYQKFTTFAEHVAKEFGEENVYSIAFTSSEGEFNSFPKATTITVPESSWEYTFAKNVKNDFTFIDFTKIRKSEFGKNQFESTILGHQPHVGKWYNIFDGVLYIRKMKPSTFK